MDISADIINNLRVYQRDGKFIIYNPTVPSWIYTNAGGALLFKILSNTLSIAKSVDIAVAGGMNRSKCEDIFHSAQANNILSIVQKSNRWDDIDGWSARKIKSIYVHLTNKCNLSCSYCYRNSSPKITIKKFGDEFIEALANARDFIHDDAGFTFSGGEPLIHPDLFNVAKYSFECGYDNSLLTNGILIDEHNAPLIIRYFTYVKISLDGASEGMHAKTRGTGNFHAVIEGINRLVGADDKENLEIEVQMTLTKENIDQVDKLNEILPDRVLTKFTPLLPMGRGKIDHPEAAINNSDFIEVSEKVTSFDENGVGRLENGQRTHGCYAGDAHISISDVGDVYPCHHFHKNKFKMGNIFVEDFKEIVFGDAAYAFGKSMDVENNNERCAGCDFRYLCGGGCKANPLHSIGRYNASDTYCSYLRHSMLDDLFASFPDHGR